MKYGLGFFFLFLYQYYTILSKTITVLNRKFPPTNNYKYFMGLCKNSFYSRKVFHKMVPIIALSIYYYLHRFITTVLTVAGATNIFSSPYRSIINRWNVPTEKLGAGKQIS